MTALPALPLFAPLLLLAVAALSLLAPGRRPAKLPRLAELAAVGAIALALGGLLQLVWSGPATWGIGSGAALLAVRLDAVSASLALLVSFVGWIVVRYSRTYLDGEAREGRFHGLMLATLAAVVLLVQAGSLLVVVLCFIAVGVALRQLLLFYPERPEARRAAAKFSFVWGAGDVALILASALLAFSLGTGSLAGINEAAAGGLTAAAQLGVALLVLAAVLKTAAFPLHGWLTEVMEAPPPSPPCSMRASSIPAACCSSRSAGWCRLRPAPWLHW